MSIAKGARENKQPGVVQASKKPSLLNVHVGVGTVFGVNEIELRDGVAPADFERAYTRIFDAWPDSPRGWKAVLLRGLPEGGGRAGKYLVLYVIDNKRALADGEKAIDEWTASSAPYRALIEEWSKKATIPGDDAAIGTNYTVVHA